MGKGIQAATIKRRLAIEEWMSNGLRRQDIIRKASEEKWGISDRAIEQYMHFVKQSWVELEKAERPFNKAKMVELLKRLYLEARQKEDLNNARQILKDLSSLQGLVTDEKIPMSFSLNSFDLDEETRKTLNKKLSMFFDPPNEK